MAKDPLLTGFFFSSASLMNEDSNDQETLEILIKRKLYPNLSADINPVYYKNAHILPDLIAFIDTPEYTVLQQELGSTIDKIKQWGEQHNIEETASLTVFKNKLTSPADRITLFYADGKKFLEKIAVLLDAPEIDLQTRKTIISNLLADKELEKCINGCYSRIATAVSHLQENLEGKQQIRVWINAYINNMARQVATQRPFAMPASYQSILCKVADCFEQQNSLHANNYLLLQAKEQGFPIASVLDQGAIELGRGITEENKKTIVTPYIKQLEKAITAKTLVNFLSDKLHENFQSVMASDIDYSVKMDKILNKLNLLGEDAWFTSNKVGLDEIISTEGHLKSSEYLKITVTERLIQRGFLNAETIQTLTLTHGPLSYRRFSSALELTWFWLDEERKSFLQLMKEDNFYNLRYLQKNSGESITIIKPFPRSLFIQTAEDLLLVTKNSPSQEHRSFLAWVPIDQAILLIQTSDSPKLFVDLLNMAQKSEKELFLRQSGDALIRATLREGLFRSDFKTLFPGLAVQYSADEYDFIAKQEGLSITKGLIKLVIANGFKNFNKFNFYELAHLKYLDDIDFSKVNLKQANFFESISISRFDEAELAGAKFWRSLTQVSFKKADLREVNFWPLWGNELSTLFLDKALLSSKSFKALRAAQIFDFVGTNLQEIDFQQADIKNRLQGLDFSNANLESVNLSKLDLRNVVLTDANLMNTNLLGTELSPHYVNVKTNLQGSQLSLSMVSSFYKKGINVFDRCNIVSDLEVYQTVDVFAFQQTSFKKAHFIGEGFKADFIESDLTEATFSPFRLNSDIASADTDATPMRLLINAKKSSLDKMVFRYVKLTADVKFTESSLKGIVFNKVEMDSTLLFVFYAQGNRDFKGVSDLKGEIPKKLLPFPVLDAELNKQSFLHLYRQGLRDFRGSNLRSFYLGQVLTEQAISEIDLKLEGTHYKSSVLGCGSRHKRARGSSNPASTCTAYFLFQAKNVDERKIVLDDIEFIAKSGSQRRVLLKEYVLGAKPIFILEYQVTEVNFYWGYRPDESDLIKSLDFTRESISSSERSRIRLNYYIFQKYTVSTVLITFTRHLRDTGFTEVAVKYYDQTSQPSVIQLKNGALSIGTESRTLGQKFRKILDNSKTIRINPLLPEDYHARLRRINSEVRRQVGQGFRSGTRQGAQYAIGAALIPIISQWLINRGPEPKEVDTEIKEKFKLLARNITYELGKVSGASEKQMETVLNVAEQCIDRLECSNEELVIKDVIDSLHRMRPDLMIGNEYAWNNIKEFFSTIGSYFSDKFDDLKQFFTRSENRSLILKDPSRWVHPIGLYPMRQRIEKRNLFVWYESPLLIRLMKAIEAGFDVLGYDMQRNDAFSEEALAGFLYELWQALAICGVNSTSSPESVLSLLENTTFTQQALNISLIKSFYGESFLAELPLNISQATVGLSSVRPENTNLTEVNQRSHLRQAQRRKRATNLTITQLENGIDKVEEEADNFLAQYEPAKRQVRKNKNKSLATHFLPPACQRSPCLNQTAIIKEERKQAIRQGDTYKFDQISSRKQRSYSTTHCAHFKQTKFKQAQPPAGQLNSISNRVITMPMKQHPSRLFPGVGNRQQKKYLGQDTTENSMLTSNHSFYHANRTRISQVTATGDLPSTLFALNMLIRSKAKTPYRPPLSERGVRLYQRAERQIENIKGNSFKRA